MSHQDNRLRWLGHVQVQRMEGNQTTHFKLLNGQLSGRRRAGSPDEGGKMLLSLSSEVYA